MIDTDDRLENPVTGEVMIFHRTSRETSGEAVLVETIVRPGGFVAAAHVHPGQTERFEVLEASSACGWAGTGFGRGRARPSRWRRERRTGSGTMARPTSASCARCGRRSRSSR